ncbi:hypothetical protein LSH36_521g00005 [Paralvinella palmiformis]|uniref:Dehydrogenase/reductase SDR family member 11 n=1 Tax=Paralvinella palmiformis TaxID=53620 RepID=A0AAD9J7R1_9ANNE|nr:hypothetical protein LSH36_521g00005 [Paralvinella palmiformis]
MDRWHGHVALVTGASKGIGEAIVKNLVNNGLKVVACARDMDLLQVQLVAAAVEGMESNPSVRRVCGTFYAHFSGMNKLAESVKDFPGEILVIQCDVSKQDQILAMFSEIQKRWGGVDVNVMGLCLCTQEAVKSMRSRGVDDGHVININSLGGHRVGKAHFYSATKFAVTALTDGIRWELRGIKSKIKISEISPGLVQTHFHDKQFGGREKALEMYNAGKVQGPLKAEDIAEVVQFLLSTPPHVQVHDVLMRHTEQEV